jgi:hypothetical protein
LVVKPKGKRPPGRPTCRLEDNVNIHLRETGWGGMDSICLAEDRVLWSALVNTAMNLQVP